MSTLGRRQFLKTVSATTLAVGATPLRWRHAHAAEEIRIGALCELSGPASTIGSQQALGIQFAVDEINKTGGILGKGPGIGGRPIKLIIEDTESKVATGVAKAKKLVERDRVDVLTGVIFSAISLAVQEYINKEAKIPYVNAGSGNPAVSEPPACGKYSFQGLPNSRQLVLPSLYAAKKHGPKWFFIADDYSWGKLSVQLTKDAIKLGSPLETVGEEYSPLGTTNYAPYVTKAMAAKPDVIGLVVFGAGYARILKQINQMGAKAHIHHNFWSQIDAEAAGEAVVGMTAGEAYTFENPKVPRAQKYAQAYHAAHKRSRQQRRRDPCSRHPAGGQHQAGCGGEGARGAAVQGLPDGGAPLPRLRSPRHGRRVHRRGEEERQVRRLRGLCRRREQSQRASQALRHHRLRARHEVVAPVGDARDA